MKAILTGKENLRFKLAKKEIGRRFDVAETLEVKKWYSSRTIWVNFLIVIAGALSFLMSPDAKMDAQTTGTLATVLGIVNMLLRMVTDKPVGK